MAAEHFLNAGCTHFAYWGPSTHHHYIVRGRAFEHRLADAGFSCAWAPPHLDLFDMNVPPPGLAEWIASLPKPVALFTCSDVTGRHAVDTCHHHGLRVPEQVAVLGVDNDELLCELAAVQLSSIAVPTERKGYEAARMLHRLMLGQSVKSPVIIQPTGVVTRRSSDLRTRDPMVSRALDMILSQPSAPLAVEDLLEHLPISRRSLERRFRAALGRSPSAEIRRLRVERAQRLLEETDLTVTQIAAAAGVADITRRRRALRRQVGMTPSAYRRQMSKGLPASRHPQRL